MLHEKLQISSTTYILSQWPENGKRCVRILRVMLNLGTIHQRIKTKIKKYSSLANKVSYTQMMVLAFFCQTVCNGFPKLHFFIRNLAQHYVRMSLLFHATIYFKKRKSTRPIQITDKAEEIILLILTTYFHSVYNTKSYFLMKFRTS